MEENTDNQKYWIVAAGDGNRSYAHICLEHGVVIMGPSYCGDWHKNDKDRNAREILTDDKWSQRKITNLNSFVNDIKIGDVIILRLGTKQIHGVGVVAEGYHYNEFFCDVDGWDLAHTHRVHWMWKGPVSDDKPVPWDVKDVLRQSVGDTLQSFQLEDKPEVFRNWMKALLLKSEDVSLLKQSLPILKNHGKEMLVSDIINKLFNYGLGSVLLSSLEDNIKDLSTLAKWYKTYGMWPSEYETTAHLITPLLRALGWTSQRIELEYPLNNKKRVDIALYRNGNRADYEPIAFIEAKKLGYSCLNAEAQIKDYAADKKGGNLKRLVVTDGIRYGIFIRKKGEKFPSEPTAYLNLTDLRDEYPVYDKYKQDGKACGGADEALLYMSSVWSHDLEHPDTPAKDDGKA